MASTLKVTHQLDLINFPPIYVLSTHLTPEEVEQTEQQLKRAGAHVTHNISEAKVIVGALTTAKRARLELQFHKLRTEPIDLEKQANTAVDIGPPRKRRKTSLVEIGSHDLDADDGSDTDFKDEHRAIDAAQGLSQLSMNGSSNASTPSSPLEPEPEPEPEPESWNAFHALKVRLSNSVLVLKREWLQDSIDNSVAISVEPYIIYHGRPVVGPPSLKSTDPTFYVASSQVSSKHQVIKRQSSLINFQAEYDERLLLPSKNLFNPESEAHHPPFSRTRRTFAATTRPTLLAQESTAEQEAGEIELPEMPRWVREKKLYACEREAPAHPPNADFINLLEEIRDSRRLTGDKIGVRAYSTSIASLAAYPHKVTKSKTISALPGCDVKIVKLFEEWQSTGLIQAVEKVRVDEVLKVLKAFCQIWGVGVTTARSFYFDDDKQWKSLDDVIEFGWNQLSRHQQIGIEFCNEFLISIPRAEVEYIASTIAYHAKQIVDDGIECIIVGGYRRGKLQSGDVDVVISHREETGTKHLVRPLVQALEDSGWITHVLTLKETNSLRDQETVALRSIQGHQGGFDTLDKALVVWQDPMWKTREKDLAQNPRAKNLNVHRRVDIIISPWRTVGCAVMGWSSGTTFQRDLRRYSKRKKNWKFDSSGVRDLATGEWLDLERWGDERNRATTCEEAERRVFERMGLAFIEPSMRNSG